MSSAVVAAAADYRKWAAREREEASITINFGFLGASSWTVASEYVSKLQLLALASNQNEPTTLITSKTKVTTSAPDTNDGDR